MKIHLAPEKIFAFGSVNFTNTFILSVLIIIALFFISKLITSRLSLIPKRLQGFFEAVMEGILNFTETVLGDRKQVLKFFPLTATIFIFILFSNWFEILPGLGSIFVRSPSSDLNFTIALAVVSVTAIQYYGIRQAGFFKYGKKFINLENPIKFFVGILEIISEMAKVVSFSFRLFGNIFAGEALLIVVYYLVPYAAPLPFLFLEIFVGFVQALVFSMLTLVFLKIATAEGGH